MIFNRFLLLLTSPHSGIKNYFSFKSKNYGVLLTFEVSITINKTTLYIQATFFCVIPHQNINGPEPEKLR